MSKGITWFFIGLSIFLGISNSELREDKRYLEDEVSSLEDDLSAYQDALEQANSNIEDAKSYAWSSYYDMGDALDSLEIVDQ